MREKALLYATRAEYPHETLRRHAFVREPCACGEVIEARTRMETDVIFAVRRHNRGKSHRAWRAAHAD